MQKELCGLLGLEDWEREPLGKEMKMRACPSTKVGAAAVVSCPLTGRVPALFLNLTALDESLDFALSLLYRRYDRINPFSCSSELSFLPLRTALLIPTTINLGSVEKADGYHFLTSEPWSSNVLASRLGFGAAAEASPISK